MKIISNIKEENFEGRKISGKIGLFVLIFCVFTSLIHVWFNSYGILEILKKNSMHLTLMMGITFLTRPASSRSPKDKPSLVDWILFFLTIATGIYFNLAYFPFVARILQPNLFDLIYGIIIIFLLIEAARRTVGLPLVLISLCFLLYIYVGPYMPGMFIHQGWNLRRIISRVTMTAEGVLGVVLMISSSYVFMFILFASFLKATNASAFFNDFSSALAGTARGGPAKIAIIASGLTGTINGSAQANVVTTGSFTIPLMKSVGYKPFFAAAVEAVASTGGILMPPIMGAAAFIMASFLGIAYNKIIIVAFTPAILYYFALFFMVDFRAVKLGLTGVSRDKLPELKKVLLDKGHMLIPLTLMIVILVVGYSALRAAFIGIITVLIASLFRKSTRISFQGLILALYEGASNGASIAIICAIVGFIVAATTMTGLGQTIGMSIIELSGGQLWLAAFFTMITAIILGMGLPASACYIVTASIAAPALILLGVPRLSAHFFSFYFGAMSGLIPPVALSSYTAATVAKCSNPTKVALTGLMLGSAGLLIPFMFIYNPVLLLINFSWSNYIYCLLFSLISLYSLAVALMGVLKIPLLIFERFLFFTIAILLINPNFMIKIVVVVIFGIMVFFHIFRSKKEFLKHKEKNHTR